MNKFAQSVAIAIFCSLNVQSFADVDFKYPTASDYPAIEKQANQIENFIPKGWRVLAKATGDLNGDHVNDAALVIQANTAKYKQVNTGLGTKDYDTNPRLLVVLLKNPKNGAYQLLKQTKNVVAGADFPTMDEPFQGISIKNGALNIKVQSFYNAGSWSASTSVYRFRVQGNSLILIGADRDEIQRNTGEENRYSFNFLTNKLLVETNSDGQKQIKMKPSWKKLPKQSMKSIDDLEKLYEWEVIKNYYL